MRLLLPASAFLPIAALLLAACHQAGAALATGSPGAPAPLGVDAEAGWPPYWTGPLLIAPERDGPTPRGGTAPTYPSIARDRGEEATAVIVFIIDTAGNAIPASNRFLREPPPSFQRSICEWLPRARFTPGRGGNGAEAALVVMPFEFSLGDHERFPTSVTLYEAELRRMSPSNRAALLRGLPSC